MTNPTKTARAIRYALATITSYQTTFDYDGTPIVTPLNYAHDYDCDRFDLAVKKAAKLAKLDADELFDAIADAAHDAGLLVHTA